MGRLVMLVVALCAAAALCVTSAVAAVPRPLQTGVHIHLPWETYPEQADQALVRIRAAGASVVRLPVAWNEVAPAERPASFAPENPADPAYRWDVVDSAVRLAAGNGLQPLLFFFAAPVWAQRGRGGPTGNLDPDPEAIAQFAKALALRYSGSFNGLPRVRLWEAWNEPNISIYYHPQLVDNRPVSPAWYREVVTRFAAAVRSVHADNTVVAGGTAPFRDATPYVQQQRPDWGPLTFMREFLCLSPDLRPTCSGTLDFDVWAHHPYTSGGPLHKAVLPDDVSLGDLPEMKRVLDAAVRLGHVRSPGGAVRFWVTEFSWDSNRPDPGGVPVSLLQRWVPEAMYRMWQNGVSLVTWFTLRDQPMNTSFYQSGLYYRGATLGADRAKPHLQAFRFPLVALRERKRVMVWGRTPRGLPGRVLVQQTFRGGWRKLGLVRTDRYGIFQSRFATAPVGSVRAQLATSGERSLPFALKPVPDRFFNPFGLPELVEP